MYLIESLVQSVLSQIPPCALEDGDDVGLNVVELLHARRRQGIDRVVGGRSRHAARIRQLSLFSLCHSHLQTTPLIRHMIGGHSHVMFQKFGPILSAFVPVHDHPLT